MLSTKSINLKLSKNKQQKVIKIKCTIDKIKLVFAFIIARNKYPIKNAKTKYLT